MMRMRGLVLEDADAAVVAALVSAALREAGRNGAAAPALLSLAARIVEQVPQSAVVWPRLAAAASLAPPRSGPVSRSVFDVQAPCPRCSERPQVTLTAEQAAGVAGTTVRAIQLACASGRLPGRKGPTGRWLIDQAELEVWLRGRAVEAVVRGGQERRAG
jgi:hypothetical protein